MRYIVRATSESGPVEFQNKRTIDDALKKAAELREAGFRRITLVNSETAVEITDLEQFIQDLSPSV